LIFLIFFGKNVFEYSTKKLHHMSKHYQTAYVYPYSLRIFQQYQEHGKGCFGLGDFNVSQKHTKQTKLPSFIHMFFVINYRKNNNNSQ
jgi:hypothetical protein